MKYDTFNRQSQTPSNQNSLHFSQDDTNIVSSLSQLPHVKTSITLEESHLNMSRGAKDREPIEPDGSYHEINRLRRSDSVEKMRSTMIGKPAVSKSQYFQRLLQTKSHERELFNEKDSIDAQINRLEQVLKKRFVGEDESIRPKLIELKKRNPSEHKCSSPLSKKIIHQSNNKPKPHILISKDDRNSLGDQQMATEQTISPRSKTIKDQDKNTTKKKYTKKKILNSNKKTNRKTERSTHQQRTHSASIDKPIDLEALMARLERTQHLSNRELAEVRKELELMKLVKQIYVKLYNSVTTRLQSPNPNRLRTIKTVKVLSS